MHIQCIAALSMEKNTLLCLLFDTYGACLTASQKEIFDLYYNEDLSLFEISEHMRISRQGVRNSLLKSQKVLQTYEEKLNILKKRTDIEEILAKLCTLTEQATNSSEIKILANKIIEII